MSNHNSLLLKIGGSCGIIVPFLAFFCILGAIASYPQFNWFSNALSDLGVVWGITASLFDTGLTITGILAIIFSFGLYAYFTQNIAGKVGAILFFIASVFLTAIGIFNETFRPTHYLVSVGFFVFMPLALFAITAAFALSKRAKWAIYTIVTGLVAAIPWILYFTIHYASNVAIPEFITSLAGAIWALVLGVQMLGYQKSLKKEKAKAVSS
jgi:hypothetical membrane protein